jgi:predicted pyridoxine 5'-phosphate oxidase superfamily flavin-nucleotide-binding protein
MSHASETFHEGEVAVQHATCEQDVADQNAPMIADAVVAGARLFLHAQRMLVVASRDARGSLWASILFGRGGFAAADDGGQSVTIDRTMLFEDETDVLRPNLNVKEPLGLLAIDLATRRRLRINGRVVSLTHEQIVVRVEESYPNCPKYIQRRRLRSMTRRDKATIPPLREGQSPDAAFLAAVKKADTLFVASGHPSRGLDASHRGGLPGFIRILAPGLFRIPDYAGNSIFNTLGNLSVDRRCGLTFPDFEAGRIFQSTGEAALHLNAPRNDDSADTGRYWDFQVQHWRSSELPVQADWEFVDYSPYNP